MRRDWIALLVVFFYVAAFAPTGNRAKVVGRINDSAQILNEIMSAPDAGIPQEIIGSAKCIAIVPSQLKVAFGFGAQRGRGVATCQTEKGWSAPAFFVAEGGSFGFQIGGQAVDLVMLIMNEQGMRALLSSKFKLGADASAAAGPVGRHVEGATDWKMRAQVLTYSRARGAFAGISLNGAVIRQDKDSTWDFYGKMIPFRSILTGEVPVPSDANTLIAVIQKYVNGTQSASTPATAKPATGGATSTVPSSIAPSNTTSSTPSTAPGTSTTPSTSTAPTTSAPTTSAPVSQPTTATPSTTQPPQSSTPPPNSTTNTPPSVPPKR
jgi:lipid-binding SYLF domain-containing protein